MTISSHSPANTGFTLLEIMIAVTLIGILATLALPLYSKMHKKTNNTLMQNELRVASAALEIYTFENGGWPPDGSGGWPTEVLDYLPPPDRWNEPSPFGGSWAWSANSDGVAASLRINNFTATPEQIKTLDKTIDDGDPTSGILLSNGTSLIYVLEK